MNNYQNQTPPPVLRNHHQHHQQQQQQQQQQQPHQQQHHNNHHFSSSVQLTPVASQSHHHHQQQQQQQQHHQLQQHQHHFTTPAGPLPPIPTAAAPLALVAQATATPHHQQHQQHHQPQQPQPLISNSLAIRQEIQRFESVHPSIYAIYDLIDLLPITDAQIAQQIRDHVVCIEAVDLETKGLILNSQAKKAVKNILKQMPCGWPERGIPPLAPYTNPELEVHLAKSAIDSIIQLIRFRLDGLDAMEIRKLKVSYTFSKKVKFDFNFKELKAKASLLNTETFVNLMKELGIDVLYEGTGPMEFALENLSLKGQFKYKMPFIFGSIKIYKFECVVHLGAVRSNIGGILGNGKFNEFINEKIEYMIPAVINGNQKKISDMIEEAFVPRINAKLKGEKFWDLLHMMGNGNSKCVPTPAPFLA